ncbi:unnamed protein product [Protopolystoma xenopodis]|uniref:G-protein coupled receptors family 1 profile domain-containing protein n=1 Tax=Protopolystoma xenopodis TaxID=117903 RepID=A0A3S5CVT5_9PLAT|nr:unnamed protein product [Protopolystoma xenopodis]
MYGSSTVELAVVAAVTATPPSGGVNWRFLSLAVLPVWTLLANGSVLVCFYQDRSLRQNLTNFIIASMALADFLLAIAVLPLAVYLKVTDIFTL